MFALCRCLRGFAVIAALVFGHFLFTAPALADDFVAKCQAFATASNAGTPPENIEKICTCVEDKLNAPERTASLEVMQQVMEADKAGEEPPKVTPDKQAAYQKVGESAVTCRGETK